MGGGGRTGYGWFWGRGWRNGPNGPTPATDGPMPGLPWPTPFYPYGICHGQCTGPAGHGPLGAGHSLAWGPPACFLLLACRKWQSAADPTHRAYDPKREGSGWAMVSTPLGMPCPYHCCGRYDVVLFDQYGVLHDGVKPLPGTLDCLAGLQVYPHSWP